MATGSEITIPQKPAIIPPADTLNITINGCNEFVLPYTFGPITFPSIIEPIPQTSAVRINNLVLITEDTSNEMMATNNPPKYGIMADTPDSIPNIK